eukprot:scaffold3_cov273-Pinguiococcus_pyrenoidosus.AAC.11
MAEQGQLQRREIPLPLRRLCCGIRILGTRKLTKDLANERRCKLSAKFRSRRSTNTKPQASHVVKLSIGRFIDFLRSRSFTTTGPITCVERLGSVRWEPHDVGEYLLQRGWEVLLQRDGYWAYYTKQRRVASSCRDVHRPISGLRSAVCCLLSASQFQAFMAFEFVGSEWPQHRTVSPPASQPVRGPGQRPPPHRRTTAPDTCDEATQRCRWA